MNGRGGACLAGARGYDPFGREPYRYAAPTQAQLDALYVLVDALQTKYSLDDDVYTHSEVS